ncbi:unnamed protein product [Withania somnifera]
MIKKISQQATTSQVTNLSNIVISLTTLIICRVAFGITFDGETRERRKFDEVLKVFEEMLASFYISDYFPLLGWVDKLTGKINRLEKNFKDLDEFYEGLIEQHLDPNRPKSMEGDIVDLLLQLKKEQSTPIDLTLENIKGIIMVMNYSIWSLRIANPNVMKKVQAEIRESVEKTSIVNENDVQDLPYFKAVIKETFRLYPPAPLLIARERMRNSTLEGYDIKQKTIVHVKHLGNCKGSRAEEVARTVELLLSNLLYAFNWELPCGMKKEDIDTDVLPGLTMHKKKPLCLVPRNYP